MKLLTSLRFPLHALALGTLLTVVDSCSVSEKVKDSPSGKTVSAEMRENKAFSQMQYRLNFMDEARLGGQDILFVRQADDFTSPQQAKMQTALQSGTLPLRMKMRIYARNPSTLDLQLKQLDYKLVLDGKEFITGATALNTLLEAGTIGTLSLDLNLTLNQDKLAGTTPAAFASGLTDFTSKNRRLNILIRPMYVGADGRQVPPTDFMPVELVTVKRQPNEK